MPWNDNGISSKGKQLLSQESESRPTCTVSSHYMILALSQALVYDLASHRLKLQEGSDCALQFFLNRNDHSMSLESNGLMLAFIMTL